MANIKISDLPASTTPLVGSEVLPIVQGTSTVNVSVANLTAGRSVSAASIANALGAAGTPSYTFTGDLNTGMWSPTADTVAVSTGGSERMRIDSAGNVGIGTSAPATNLHINQSTGGASIEVSHFSGGTYPKATGISFGSNNGTFDVANAGGTKTFRGSAGIYANSIEAVNTRTGLNLWTTDGANKGVRLYIAQGGNVGIGNISPTSALDVVGGIKTSRTDVTAPAATDGNIFSGTYTPTLTNINRVDIAGSTAFACQYMRVGNVVTVSGKVNIAVTSTGLTQLNMTLPVASNFSAEENCAGVAQVYYSGGAFSEVAGIMADITNDRAQIFYDGNVTGAAQSFFFTYTYRII